MPLLIEGRKQPSNDIDMYLKPLIEELLMMLNDGVEVSDEDKRETFTLRAMLFVTIQDLPALSSLSGQVVKGFNGCVQCMDDTSGVWLKNYKKVVYIGTRRFLRTDQPFHRNKKSFNGKIQTRPPSIFRDGKQVFAMVKDVRIVFEKGPSSTSVLKYDNKAPMWKKR